MLRDFKYVVRLLRKAPGFTATAILILAIAIAGNTATFSAVNALLLEPLPFRDAGRLVVVGTRHRSTGERAGVSFPDYEDWTREPTAFNGAGAVRLEQQFNLSGAADPVRVAGGRMSASVLPLLGVTPLRGRGFLPEDERPGAQPVVLITHRFWQDRFARSEDAVGREIAVDGVRTTIVGVLPADFRLLYGGYAIWAPLVPDPTSGDRSRRSLLAIGRLPEDVSIERSAATIAAVAARLEREHPDTNAGWRVSMVAMRDFLLAGRGHTLLFVMTAVGLLLLVACANVASLQLARAAARQQEIATRFAIGASRWLVVRLLVSEAAVVAATSGVIALGLVAAARRILLASTPDLRELTISLPALGFTIALMLATTLAFGLVPALIGTRVDLTAALNGTAVSRRSTRRLRSALVIAELSSSLVLLVPAGLLFKSFLALRETQPGFRVEDVLTFGVALTPMTYPDARRQEMFYDTTLARFGAMPGVQSAAVAEALPLDIPSASEVEIRTLPPGSAASGQPRAKVRALVRSVSPSYLRTFEIPLRAGRSLMDSDTSAAPPVAIVNETLAAAMRGDTHVVGEQIGIDGRTLAIVGVAADLRSVGLRTPPQPEVLVPWRQRPRMPLAFAIATTGDPRQLIAPAREVVRTIDRDLPLSYVRPMAEIVDEQLVAIRTVALLLAALASLALVLAAAGLSGIMSWLVTLRTHEIGVRAALGATRRQLVALVVRDALVLVAWGILLGLPVAAVVARLVASQLWGVNALDLPVFLAVPATLALVACAACYAPARRVARFNPAAALRAN